MEVLVDKIVQVSRQPVENSIKVGDSYLEIKAQSLTKKSNGIYSGYIDDIPYSIVVTNAVAMMRIGDSWDLTYYIDGFGFADLWRCPCLDFRHIQDVIDYVVTHQTRDNREYLFYLLQLTRFYRVSVDRIADVVVRNEVTAEDLRRVKRAYAKSIMYQTLGKDNALQANLYLLNCDNFQKLPLYCGKTIDIDLKCSFGCFNFSSPNCSCMSSLWKILYDMPSRILTEREIIIFKNLAKVGDKVGV